MTGGGRRITEVDFKQIDRGPLEGSGNSMITLRPQTTSLSA